MVQFFLYLVRLFAAVILVGLCLLMVVVAFSSNKGREVTFGVAAVFGVAGAFAWPRRPNAWRRDPPTERQLAFARDLGIQIPRGISKGDLSDLISQAKQIRDAF